MEAKIYLVENEHYRRISITNYTSVKAEDPEEYFL